MFKSNYIASMFVSLQKINLKSAFVRQRAESQECSATRGERAECGNGAKRKKKHKKGITIADIIHSN